MRAASIWEHQRTPAAAAAASESEWRVPESFQRPHQRQLHGCSAPKDGCHSIQQMLAPQHPQEAAQWEQQQALQGPPGAPLQPPGRRLPQYHQPRTSAERHPFHAQGRGTAAFETPMSPFQAPQMFTPSQGFHLQPQHFGSPGSYMQGGYGLSQQQQQQQGPYFEQGNGYEAPGGHMQHFQQAFGQRPGPPHGGRVPHAAGHLSGAHLLDREASSASSASAMLPDQSSQSSGDASGKLLLSMLQRL